MRTLASCFLLLMVAACSGEPTSTALPAAKVAWPEGLFPAGNPPAAKDVEDVKKAAKAGDDIVLQAQVGGRKQWQVDGKTMFLVIDPVLESCDETEGDHCPTPWDFCCVPKEQITKKLATVRVVGADGQPLACSVEGAHGIKPLAHVVVAGRVQSNDGANLVLDAKQIWVK